MKLTIKRILSRILKVTGITMAGLALLLYLLPLLFPGAVSTKVKGWINHSINGTLNFSGARLSFFTHFPSLTLTLYDFSLKGSAPFQQDTLIAARKLSLGIDLSTVFSRQIKIDKIFLTRGTIHIEVNKNGEANYNVYQPAPEKGPGNPEDSSSAGLRIRRIVIENSHVIYQDQSVPLVVNARGFNYRGTGNLSESVFDLHTHAFIDSLDFFFDHTPYVLYKKVNANLITRINTHSLTLQFRKNDLKINTLPVHFTGQLNFLEQGYDMNFELNSGVTDLHDVFTALPPEYAGWLQETEVKGATSLVASLKGRYDAKNSLKPALEFDMQVKDGTISHQKAEPLRNLNLSFRSRLPSLDPDSLTINMDSLSFRIGKGFLGGSLHIRGLERPYIRTDLNMQIDLDRLTRAVGIQAFAMKGTYDLHAHAEGVYATGVRRSGLRQVDTVITSIPAFSIQSSLKDGYFKFRDLSQPLTGLSFNLKATCPDSNYHHARITADQIRAQVLSNYVRGSFSLSAVHDFPLDVNLQSSFHLQDLSQCLPMDSVALRGDLAIQVTTRGKYNPKKKLFPVTRADIRLDQGSVRTKYYPHPVEQIQLHATVLNTDGTMKGTSVSVQPLSFSFEGQPFMLHADLRNFDDLRYRITSKGTLDIGKIYHVFSRRGTRLDGQLKTDLALSGRQSDATGGRYDQLHNRGTLRLKNISLSSDLFPKPFLIRSGLFRFKQDRIWMDGFRAGYGASDFTLSGYLSNIINYLVKDTGTLTGSFNLKSNHVLVDEFAAFAGEEDPSGTASGVAKAPGVIMVPAHLDLGFAAEIKKLEYNGIGLKDVKGRMKIDSGRIRLGELAFNIIGAPVTMDAGYEPMTPMKAVFDYHISAQHFDVRRAYREIPVFRELASSASKAEGIVSLDYKLSGTLDSNMHPVYPSLKGGGSLTLQRVKVKGLKLFGAVSSATHRGSINNPDLSDVTIKSSIANNLITIQRTKMRVFGFRPRIEGQVSLDGRLDLQFRLGLPPFGVIGIPMTITGTESNPEVHLRKGKQTDHMEPTTDEEP